jgi:putative tricarboxylic transport membrane protein
MRFMTSDRTAGVLLLLIALAYLSEARSFETGFIADPIGPKAFPFVLGTGLLVLSMVLTVRPGPGTSWPSRRLWWRWVVVIAGLLIYASVLNPLGWVVSTTLLLVALSLLFGGRLSRSLVFALVFSVTSYVVFRWLLALGLPPGAIFGGR